MWTDYPADASTTGWKSVKPVFLLDPGARHLAAGMIRFHLGSSIWHTNIAQIIQHISSQMSSVHFIYIGLIYI